MDDNNGTFFKMIKKEMKKKYINQMEAVRQSNIQLTCFSYRRICVNTRLRCSLLNCDYTLQVLQQVATNDYKPNDRCITQTVKH